MKDSKRYRSNRTSIFGDPICRHVALAVNVFERYIFISFRQIPNVFNDGCYLPRRRYPCLYCADDYLIISFNFNSPISSLQSCYEAIPHSCGFCYYNWCLLEKTSSSQKQASSPTTDNKPCRSTSMRFSPITVDFNSSSC